MVGAIDKQRRSWPANLPERQRIPPFPYAWGRVVVIRRTFIVDRRPGSLVERAIARAKEDWGAVVGSEPPFWTTPDLCIAARRLITVASGSVLQHVHVISPTSFWYHSSLIFGLNFLRIRAACVREDSTCHSAAVVATRGVEIFKHPLYLPFPAACGFMPSMSRTVRVAPSPNRV